LRASLVQTHTEIAEKYAGTTTSSGVR